MTKISVCTGRSCSERHSQYILTRLRSDKARFDTEDTMIIEECMCRGNCSDGPNVLFDKEMFSRMNPVKASEVLMKRIQSAKQSIAQKKS